MGEFGKERVEKCFIVLSVNCYDANVNGCKTLHFGKVILGENGKEHAE